MKRLAITTVLSFIILFAFGQTDVMVIEKNDGSTLKLNVNGIKRATFTTEVIEVPISLNSNRTLVVKLTGDGASDANVKYAGESGARSGNNFTFEDAASNGVIAVTGSGLISQNVPISFGERSTMVIEIEVVKASTNIVSQTVAEAGTDVKNDEGNQLNTGVTATLNLATNGSITDYSYTGFARDYSLVVYTQAVAPITSVAVSQSVGRAPYTVDCQPSGVMFNPAAHIELFIPGISDIGDWAIDFRYGNNDERALYKEVEDGDVLKADVPHFSAWNVFVSAVCTNISESTEVIATGPLVSGENNVTYSERCGFRSNERGVLNTYLKLLFGSTYTQVSKSAVINAESTGTYTIVQKSFEMTFRAGNKIFQAVVYGKPYCDVLY
jgi:hypothetical protein